MEEQQTFSTKEFASLVNREVRTLYIWARTGKLIPQKDFANRNIYTSADYEKVMNRKYLDDSKGEV